MDLLLEWILTNLGAAAQLAAFFGLMTFAALSLTPQTRRDDIALWLMGTGNQPWAQGFLTMFDALFGRNHLSLHCALRSSVASVLFVALI